MSSNRTIAQDYYRMRFEWSNDSEEPAPGQFVSIKSFGTTDLVLRRPFAFSAFDPRASSAEIIYQKRGKATTMLAGRAPGEAIDLIAPLGNCFPVPQGEKPLLVGGGVGLGPILFFGNWLAARGFDPTVVLGFRNRSFVPDLLDKRADVAFTPVICTDDGSRGFHGTTVDWLLDAAGREPERFAGCVVHACGPNPMMSACSRFCEARGLRCFVSMEQIMGCGVGACIGCAIPVCGDPPYARVCTDGPVFDARQIQWERMT